MKRPALFLISAVMLLGGAGWTGAALFGNDSPAAAAVAPVATERAVTGATDPRCEKLVSRLRGRALSNTQLRAALDRHPDCPAVVVDAPPSQATGPTRVVTLPSTVSVAPQPVVSGDSYESEDEAGEHEGYEGESD